MTTTVDTTQLDALRSELKQWERNFAATHGGRKASREDIKQDAAIGRSFPSQWPSQY